MAIARIVSVIPLGQFLPGDTDFATFDGLAEFDPFAESAFCTGCADYDGMSAFNGKVDMPDSTDSAHHVGWEAYAGSVDCAENEDESVFDAYADYTF